MTAPAPAPDLTPRPASPCFASHRRALAGRGRAILRASFLLMGVLVAPLGEAWAAPLSWEALGARVSAVYAAGPGAQAAATLAGLRAAADRPQRGPSAAWAQIQRGAPGQNQVTAAVDLPLTLGRAAGDARRSAVTAAAAASEAEAAAWLGQAQLTWLDGWAARENADHLAEYGEELRGWLDPLRAARDQSLLSRWGLADLEAELAWVGMEAAAAREAATVADAALSALLGEPVEIDPGDDHVHEREPAGADPWPGLAGLVDRAPAVRAAAAAADQARAELRATRAEGRPVASLGGAAVDGADGRTAPMFYGGISVPLRSDRGARAAAAAGEAAGWTREAEWRAQALRAAIEAESRRYAAARDRAVTLQEQVVVPLRARQDALAVAFAAGQVPAERLIRARRDLHEAEHEQITVQASLLASEARAAALRAQLGPDPSAAGAL
jgi:hypothetical protein